MKQVLVSGDELNYYSTKCNFKNVHILTNYRKASYFLARAKKLENENIKKKISHMYTE